MPATLATRGSTAMPERTQTFAFCMDCGSVAFYIVVVKGELNMKCTNCHKQAPMPDVPGDPGGDLDLVN